MTGASHTEETPGDIQHDVLRDEATLARAPTFEIDGKERKAVVENEVVSVLDYNYLGRVETVSVEGVAASSYLGMTVTEPAEKIFRVVERRGTVCAPHGGAVKDVALDLTHPYWNVAEYNYHLVFAWKIS